ncbi:hypothetical protein GCM10009818_12150 [Nakamurella flavida]
MTETGSPSGTAALEALEEPAEPEVADPEAALLEAVALLTALPAAEVADDTALPAALVAELAVSEAPPQAESTRAEAATRANGAVHRRREEVCMCSPSTHLVRTHAPLRMSIHPR